MSSPTLKKHIGTSAIRFGVVSAIVIITGLPLFWIHGSLFANDTWIYDAHIDRERKSSTVFTHTLACPDFSIIMDPQTDKTCHRTKHFPFLTGCPEHCARTDTIDGEPLYRMTLEWYFGQPDQYPLTDGLKTAYDKGINFQCPLQFAKTFKDSANWMYTTLQTNMPNTTGKLVLKKQKRMHLSLSYLCCLRRSETDWAREAFHKFIQQESPFEFSVVLDNLQCWHEGENSVTFIIVAGEKTQCIIHQLHSKLNQYLADVGVPVVVPRNEQMPYHVTLMGVRNGVSYSDRQEDSIRDQLPMIQNMTRNLSERTNWMGDRRGRSLLRPQVVAPMVIRHGPYYSPKPIVHAWD